MAAEKADDVCFDIFFVLCSDTAGKAWPMDAVGIRSFAGDIPLFQGSVSDLAVL